MSKLVFIICCFSCFRLSAENISCYKHHDTIPLLIEDGDFIQPCLSESQFKPYTFEQNGHSNTPDILFLKRDGQSEQWYWKEFGCLAERLVIPYLPLHYACTRPGKEPLVPSGYSGDQYIGLIKESETTEALVYQLKVPLLPGMAFRLSLAARALSDSCALPKVLIVGSKTEPCRQISNMLHPSDTTTICSDSSLFQPMHLLLSNPLPNRWEKINHVFIPKDTIYWVIITLGNTDSALTNPYLGIDALEIDWLNLEVDMQLENYKTGIEVIHEWTIIIKNPVEEVIPGIISLLHLDQMVDSLDCPDCADLLSNGFTQMIADLPAAKNGLPGIYKTQIRLYTHTDCPVDNVLFMPGFPSFKPFWIRYPETGKILFVPATIDSLSKAVQAGILPSDSIIGADIYFQGDIIWDLPDYTFRDCQIQIGWGNRITVSKNAGIQLEETHLIGCGKPWDELLIHNEGKINIRGGRIKDVKNAIKVQAGGILQLHRTAFDGLETDIETEIIPLDNAKKENRKGS